MGASSPPDANLLARLERQEIVTDLSQRALETDDLDQFRRDAAAAVTETLATDYCVLLESLPDGENAVLRQCVGWERDGERTTIEIHPDSQTGRTLRTAEPVVVDDLDTDEGFAAPEFLPDRDVRSSLSVRVGPADDPWGVLGVYAAERRAFSDVDGDFLRRVVTVLESAIENERDRTRRERRFDAIFEDPNVLVGLLEPDGTVVDVNETAMEYVDADREAVTGEPFWALPWMGTDDGIRSVGRQWIERAATGENVDFEVGLGRSGDERAAFEGVCRPVTNDEGAVVSVVVSARDGTVPTDHEPELATLMDNVPGMVYRCRNERGWPMEFVSDACDALTGYDPDTLESGDIEWGSDVMVQADREMVWETVQRETRAEATFSETYRIETADGEIRWVRDYGRGVFDDDGDLVAVEGIIADITERKRLESDLEQYREYTDAILDTIDDVFYVADREGSLQRWNQRLVEVSGYTDAEIASMEPLALFDGDDERAVSDAIREGFETGTATVELALRTKDGTAVPFEFTASRLEDPRGNTVLAGIGRDITDRLERERRLEESERRYRTLAQRFPNGAVGVFDRDLTYTLAEGAELGETLPSADRLEEDRMPDIFPDHTADDLEPLFRAAVEDGETDSVETAFDGRIWRVWATPLRDEDGEIFAGLSFAQDVTERVERKKHLERYETIVEVVNDGVYVVSEDGRFTMVNETYASMLGAAPSDLVGTDAGAVVDDAVLERIAELEAATAAGPIEWPTIEADLQTAGGETLPVEATFEILPTDDSAWHRVGVVRDISERKDRERRLEESERRYRTLVENFPEGAVGLFDETLAYTAVGGQLYDEVGIATDDRVGNSVSDIYPESVLDEIEPYFDAALEGETNAFEIEFYGRHLYAHTLPVRNADDEIFAGMVVVQDVTERREYQRKLEASNERLEQFAYAASHDLQEPLRMVTSYLQLLEQRYGDAFDEDGEEFLAYAVDGAERMREMIDGLLEYSRIETRGDPFEPVDLDAVLEDVLADLRLRIEETDADITTAELPRVAGDPSQLRQVLQNLLSNAITYSGDDPPRIRVGAERRNGEWVLSVTDEGIGIDPEDQDRVFTVFDRLHSREEYAGTGIGLALCERIVERHGGEIWVDSEPGEGATFSFTLPAR
ncbi:PAS domain S-box protein [Natrinema salaciae]|uniref:histidine kinase n=1 Tax=Natrinema salaciae TaxID=1186196 RepID=A0A1H9K0S2_9EURY|nr:PAS domain S-box protein [Natrinema salaciae]SEQ92513.1 PAS domain S-box-containing protein [Natrinema salaciae]